MQEEVDNFKVRCVDEASVRLRATLVNNNQVILEKLEHGNYIVRFVNRTKSDKGRTTRFMLSDSAMAALVDMHYKLNRK